MKISFPIMGNSYIVFKQLVNDLGHEAILAPMPSSKTMSLGTMHSPEFACIPFKILLGTYLEAIEKGAELILASGGHGPCRAGYYGVLHQKIIHDLGYNTEVMVFDSIVRTKVDFFKKLNRLVTKGKKTWWNFGKIVTLAWKKLYNLDEIEILSHQIRPYEVNKGQTTKAYRQCLAIMEQARTFKEITRAKNECFELLKKIPQDRSKKPLKIGIVGEIYVLIEPFANLDIQQTLGEMGVYTERATHLCNWTKENLSFFHHEAKAIKVAKPYLNQMIGGHGINTIGETILFANRGFDGVVQLAPFSCIPEIVAKGILPQVSKDVGIPVMTIFLDEQTGKAGMQTRLEAFVDLLKQRQQITLGGAIS